MPKNPSHAVPARPRVRRGNVEDANRLRADLIDAAMAQFVEGGVDAVTMRGIAAAVGVSPMTPYRYFEDKSELLSGLWVSVMTAVRDRMAAVEESGLPGLERQRASIDAFLRYWEENPDQYRLIYMTETTSGRELPLGSAPVYAEILALGDRETRAVAAEIGAGLAHAKLAGDLRIAMQLGYLQAALANRRYPWSERAVLRAAYIEQIMAMLQRVLLHGPGTPTAPRSAVAPGASKGG